MKRARGAQAQDRLAVERWINEGGRVAAEAVIEREMAAGDDGVRGAERQRGQTAGPARAGNSTADAAMSPSPAGQEPAHPRVLIAGGGVAGLETLLALRALAQDRLDVTILAPELKFINRSMAVEQPFMVQRVRGLRLEDTAAELGARWHRGALDRVEHDQHRVVTKDGDELPYDRLVLAVGAQPEREWHSQGVLTYHGGRDGPSYRLLLHQLREGRVDRVAFVKPAGASWPLPLYDLALLTAAGCAAHNRTGVELSLITPEEEPLGIFGSRASAAIRRLLDESGVTLHTSSYGVPNPPGWLDISPGDRSLAVDRIITEPRLVGPRLRGIPCGRDGFIHTDPHGRVPGLDDVFAAGDATAFPVKQGGLAAQQADAVAEAIAASAGADIDPQPFRPILRGTLLTGGRARYLRADISGAARDDSLVSGDALWWPPNKLCGRYLAPYLSSQTGAAADVMPQDEHAIPVETALDPVAPDTRSALDELCDLPPR
jgi:sulfide:quinone oxidoreductase